MSKIIAIAHLETKHWEVNIANLTAFSTNLYIGFTDEAPVIQFKNLQFKYELRQGENIKQYGTYPPPGVRYVRSDQTYLVIERLNNLKPDETYQLYLWAQNDGTSFETINSFIVPRPSRPYDSWTWDGEQWTSPMPYPGDGNKYTWNETANMWEHDNVMS
jgi:hypothetical protein